MPETQKTWRTIDSVETSCKIFNVLQEKDGAGITEVANELGISKSGAHSHLATLVKNELVVKRDGTYQLSLRFLSLGEYVKRNTNTYDVVREEVDELAEKTGEVVQFLVEEHGWGVYIYKERGESAVMTAAHTGDRKHLHCTGVGKAILAHLPQARVEQIIDKHGLPPVTERTITDRDRLFEELKEIRERGVSFDDEEVQRGLRCAAVPVEGENGELLGAISVAGPTSRMQGERFREEVPAMLKDTANVIQINSSLLD